MSHPLLPGQLGPVEGPGLPPLHPGGVEQGEEWGLVLNSLPLAESPEKCQATCSPPSVLAPHPYHSA